MKWKINKTEYDKSLSKLHLTLKWKKYVKEFVQNKMSQISEDFLRKFNNHPVTKELKMGPEGSNISGTLSGYSNLFGFIGFYEEDDPVGPLEAILKQYEIVISSSKGVTKVKINLPKMREIYNATPIPWASGFSWVRGIENGIAGFGKYLSTDSVGSRSGEGIQVKYEIRNGRFTPSSYLTPLLKEYKKNVINLKSKFR